MSFFADCESVADAKKRWWALAREHHPDHGGDTATMQEINNEYERVCESFAFEEEEPNPNDLNYSEFAQAIMKIMDLPVDIEICGTWAWVSGTKKEHAERMKDAGFKWAPKKKKWAFGVRFRRGKPISMDEIRNKYGSERVERSYSQLQLATDE